MDMMVGLLAIVIALLIWGTLSYNRLVSLARFKDEAWSGIAVQLKRRHDLAPNLFDVVKRYAQHETTLLEEIARQRRYQNGSSRDVVDNEQRYSATLGRVFALAESWPELKSSANFLALQQSLSDIEEQLQLARRYFNATVRDYNINVDSFPSLIIARLFHFAAESSFELENADESLLPRME
ncbi:LemA family protein [Pseudocitrobacter cyperus]|uniref:LemA family protein n=1 Tax=Pseudocitrobacter cyperus TaxID=3112843 RepID=A0ABV0HEW4_9ENTR